MFKDQLTEVAFNAARLINHPHDRLSWKNILIASEAVTITHEEMENEPVMPVSAVFELIWLLTVSSGADSLKYWEGLQIIARRVLYKEKTVWDAGLGL